MASKMVWRSLWLPTRVARRQAAPFAFGRPRSFAQVASGISNSTPKPARRQIEPLRLPSIGYETIPADELVDEETFPGTNLTEYYPAQLGEVLLDRYQIIAKVGFSDSSTVWLGKDLMENKYVTIKICVHGLRDREREFYKLYEKGPTSCENDEIARSLIRSMHSSFSVDGPHGKHRVMILQPAHACLFVLNHLYDSQPDYLTEDKIKFIIHALLFSTYYLHARVRCVHTNIHMSSVLVEAESDEGFRTIENKALETPVPRKQVGDHTLYRPFGSHYRPGRTLLAGFNHVHLGLGPHTTQDIMPIQLRAPEVVLKLPWTWPVDVWSIGLLAWELMQQTILFPSLGKQDDLCTRVPDDEYDAVHLAQMVAALGPPPASLLDRDPEKASEFWRCEDDGSGGSTWTWASKKAEIPVERTLESMQIKSKEPELFVQFIRRALTWDPDERPDGLELLEDPWLEDEDAEEDKEGKEGK